jgi:hypothetical protein
MELTNQSDVYTPGMDNMGNYVDKIPLFTTLNNGIRCPCGSRKDKVYFGQRVFVSHTKTKCHQLWLENLNLNKINYFVQNEELKQTISNQKIIIAKFEKDLQNTRMTIDYLTQQLIKKPDNQYTSVNLLDL